MSQSQVEELFEKNKGKWFTVREISKAINLSEGSCANNLTRCIKHRTIERRKRIIKSFSKYFNSRNWVWEYSSYNHQRGEFSPSGSKPKDSLGSLKSPDNVSGILSESIIPKSLNNSKGLSHLKPMERKRPLPIIELKEEYS